MNQYLVNSNAYQPSFQFPLSFNYEDAVDEDDISRTVKEVVEGVNIFKYVDFSSRDAHGYDGIKMLECVLLAFALSGYVSTRNLEQLCKYDIRFQFIMDGQTPSHMSFQRFIHDDLTMSVEDIFYELSKYFEKHDEIKKEVLYIDGSKWEANANKMTFVWMKATKKYREKCWVKIMKHLQTFNKYCEKEDIPIRFSILKELSFDYLSEIVTKIEDIMKARNIEFVHGKGKRKHPLQRYHDTFKECAMKLWKYMIYYDLADGRNSFSKTEPDSTFMHMKYDYYNHTNVFKPGYNIQIGNSDNYIRHVYISSDANDLNTYIPFMEGYYRAYGEYPIKTPADAGYGSFDNYTYCKTHGIELYMKYSGMRKEAEKKNDENKFKRFQMKPNENDEIICPDGHAFTLEKIRISKKGRYPKTIETYRNEHCNKCPFRAKCTRSKNGRTVRRNRQLEQYQNEVKENLSTEEGKQLMRQRSVQSEGIFGQIKQDNGYDRIRRKGFTAVKTEILLVCIGHNLRRYHTRKLEKKREELKAQQSQQLN